MIVLILTILAIIFGRRFWPSILAVKVANGGRHHWPSVAIKNGRLWPSFSAVCGRQFSPFILLQNKSIDAMIQQYLCNVVMSQLYISFVAVVQQYLCNVDLLQQYLCNVVIMQQYLCNVVVIQLYISQHGLPRTTGETGQDKYQRHAQNQPLDLKFQNAQNQDCDLNFENFEKKVFKIEITIFAANSQQSALTEFAAKNSISSYIGITTRLDSMTGCVIMVIRFIG